MSDTVSTMDGTVHKVEPSPHAVEKVVDALRERDRQTAMAGVRALLRLAGEDPDRSGLLETPARVVRAFAELTNGKESDPSAILSRTFDDIGDVDEMIAVGPIEFVSLCEHHLLPFTGNAWVAYKPEPGGLVVGLSKIPRLVEALARRPQVQERLTSEVTQALVDHLGPNAACVIKAHHSCMGLRGVRKPQTLMTTSSLQGLFREDGRARAEFLALTGSGP